MRRHRLGDQTPSLRVTRLRRPRGSASGGIGVRGLGCQHQSAFRGTGGLPPNSGRTLPLTPPLWGRLQSVSAMKILSPLAALTMFVYFRHSIPTRPRLLYDTPMMKSEKGLPPPMVMPPAADCKGGHRVSMQDTRQPPPTTCQTGSLHLCRPGSPDASRSPSS
jgi:hypothetical protein